MSFQQFIGLMTAPPSQLTLPSAHFCSVPEADVDSPALQWLP